MRGSRRAAGEGTYEQLKSGLWRNVVRKDGRKVAGPAKPTRAEARAALLGRLAEPSKAASSFTTYARFWLKQRKLSPTTLETYGYWIGSLEQDGIGPMPISRISDSDLKKWLATKKDWAAATKRKRCAWIDQVLKDAGSAARCPRTAPKDHERRPISPEEQRVLMERVAAQPPSVRLALMLCLMVGLRRSETCGLRHEDREGDGVRLRRVVLITKGKLHVRHMGKSAKALSWVALPKSLRSEIGEGRGYVCGDGESPMNPKVLYGDWKRTVKGTSLENVRYLGLHALRRTFGRLLLESGADVATAAKAMRHDPAMLLREYARSRDDLVQKAVEAAFPEAEATHEAPRGIEFGS
jgi:integrase